MKKIAAMVLAGVLAAVPVSTTGAAEFQDGADTQNFIWAAGEETSTDTDESKGVSANDSVVEGLDKPLVFYPNTYYKFNVTGAGTQNTNPVEGDVRWTPLYWSLSLKPQESDIHRKWEIGSAKGIYTKVERAYNIYIFFQREEYTGGIWEKNDIVQPVRYQFNAAPLTEQGGSYKYLIGGIGYKILNEREVSVTGLAAEYNVIQIPATVVINDKVYKVTTIDKNAFSGNKEITDVIFGNNVKRRYVGGSVTEAAEHKIWQQSKKNWQQRICTVYKTAKFYTSCQCQTYRCQSFLPVPGSQSDQDQQYSTELCWKKSFCGQQNRNYQTS